MRSARSRSRHPPKGSLRPFCSTTTSSMSCTAIRAGTRYSLLWLLGEALRRAVGKLDVDPFVAGCGHDEIAELRVRELLPHGEVAARGVRGRWELRRRDDGRRRLEHAAHDREQILSLLRDAVVLGDELHAREQLLLDRGERIPDVLGVFGAARPRTGTRGLRNA